MHPQKSDTRSVPTTELDIGLILSLCRPVFAEARSRHPTISWAGVFGSVSRGTQRPDSDVDILVGYSKHADLGRDVCGSFTWLMDNLTEVLGRKADVVLYLQNSEMTYIHMEALLSAKTIWGDVSWLMTSRKPAEHMLRQGYARTKKTSEMLSRIQETILLFEVCDQMDYRKQSFGVLVCSH
jgi:predicted nucleotidyltransferase